MSLTLVKVFLEGSSIRRMGKVRPACGVAHALSLVATVLFTIADPLPAHAAAGPVALESWVQRYSAALSSDDVGYKVVCSAPRPCARSGTW